MGGGRKEKLPCIIAHTAISYHIPVSGNWSTLLLWRRQSQCTANQRTARRLAKESWRWVFFHFDDDLSQVSSPMESCSIVRPKNAFDLTQDRDALLYKCCSFFLKLFNTPLTTVITLGSFPLLCLFVVRYHCIFLSACILTETCEKALKSGGNRRGRRFCDTTERFFWNRAAYLHFCQLSFQFQCAAECKYNQHVAAMSLRFHK